jgi:dTDP-4-dehydrorhamnose 3,5-epimerase
MSHKGVLRGIHCDSKRWKLCQCAYGSVYHVAVDLVADSPTYGKWVSNVLSNENRLQILVPPMHGNSFQVLSDHAIFHYVMTEYYDPEREKTYAWNDPKLSIPWPITPPALSQRDRDAQWLEQ